jgi:hypothetical protein
MRKFLPFVLASVVLLLGRAVQAETGSNPVGTTQDPVHVTSCQPSTNTNFSNPNRNDYPIAPLPGYDVATDVYPPGDLTTVSPNSVLSQYPYGSSHSPNNLNGKTYLAIAYTNWSKNAVRTVKFGLVVGDYLLGEVLDKETASAGVEVKHALALDADIAPISTKVECVPLQVTFVDGTHWTNPRMRGLKKTYARGSITFSI